MGAGKGTLPHRGKGIKGKGAFGNSFLKIELASISIKISIFAKVYIIIFSILQNKVLQPLVKIDGILLV